MDPGHVTWPAVERDEAFLRQPAQRLLHAPRAGVLGMGQPEERGQLLSGVAEDRAVEIAVARQPQQGQVELQPGGAAAAAAAAQDAGHGRGRI